MLSDFSWDMTGYIPKHAVNPHGDGIIPYAAERIFQLEPEPPAVGNLNEYILSALQEKNLIYFSFFLHHYEPQLNKRIKDFLGVDGGDLYDTNRFIDIKLSCREQMLQKLMDYDLAKGAEYATYIFPFIRDAMLRFRMGEEKWSVSSLTNYKMVRSMAWLYHNTKDAVNEFSKKYNCDLALAEEYLKVVRGIRNQQPFYVTDEDGEETGEDVALDDSWNYTDILWNGIQAEKVQRAFEKLNYREQTLLEKRLAICMTCGRVSSWKDRPTFEELAVMFEGSTASGAERAYRKAVDKLTELLVAEGAIHAVRLKQKSKTKRKKKIAAAIYEYQADCDGEWGEISLDFDPATDRRVAKRMMQIVKEKCGDLPTVFAEVIDKRFGGDTDAYVDYLYDNSVFATEEGTLAFVDDFSVEKRDADPAVVFVRSLDAKLLELADAQRENNRRFKDGHRLYIAGLMRMQPDKAWASNANFTIRLTYGRVLPYDPADGIRYNYYTTLKGVMEKEDPKNPTEFTVPDKLKELYAAKDFGRYANAEGELPVAFLADCDITGGNSGSPVMNAKGELIGLAFDGNWEAMSGDVAFEPQLQRTIAVDVRYVLFVIDKFAGAKWLIDELSID